LRLEKPDGSVVTLPVMEGVDTLDVSMGLRESWRGTRFLSVYVHPREGVDGIWGFSFPGFTGSMHGLTVTDDPNLEDRRWDVSDWKYSVASPGTADSAITVGAYDNDDTGRMAWFSGEGPRLDGKPAVDIAAPGVRILTATTGGERPRFRPFTGTSAAIPFVAGAAALLKQAFPDMESGLFRSLLSAGAVRDSLTSNPDWSGAGRLRIHRSLVAGLERRAQVTGRNTLAVAAVPNPSSGPADIAWTSSGGAAEVRVFSVTGRLLWESTVTPGAGAARVTWDGRDDRGAPAASGVYFAHVRDGARAGVTRLVRSP
jgi:subtilisin family serine protease